MRQISFQLDTLENMSEKHILEHFQIGENFSDVRRAGERLNRKKMIEEADAFILKNFLQICELEEFLVLSFECLKNVLSSSDLKVKKEEEVLEAVVKWAEKNAGRECELKQLLGCVRMDQLERGGLSDVAMENGAMHKALIEAQGVMAREMEVDDSCRPTGQRAVQRAVQKRRSWDAHARRRH